LEDPEVDLWVASVRILIGRADLLSAGDALLLLHRHALEVGVRCEIFPVADDHKTADHAQLRQANGWDHCFALQPWRTCAAELHSPDSGLSMQVISPMPGLQLYGGQGLPEGLSGLCLEPQFFPDSPNFAHFPSCVLHPGQEYVHRIEYRFALGE